LSGSAITQILPRDALQSLHMQNQQFLWQSPRTVFGLVDLTVDSTLSYLPTTYAGKFPIVQARSLIAWAIFAWL